MTPEYETAIDSLLTRLIEIIDSASQRSIEELDVELKQAIGHTHRVLENEKEWKYCKYALACWVDSEIIVQFPKWKDNTLEAHYFGTTNAFTKFYTEAKRCYEEKRYFNAYEVFFICFMFGFRGVYQPNYRTEVPDDLPRTDAEWQSQTAKRLAEINKVNNSGWENTRILESRNQPLTGFSSFINNLVFFCMLSLAITVLFVLMNLGKG